MQTFHHFTCRANNVKQIQTGNQVELMECLTFLFKVICEQKFPELVMKAVQILFNLCKVASVPFLNTVQSAYIYICWEAIFMSI